MYVMSRRVWANTQYKGGRFSRINVIGSRSQDADLRKASHLQLQVQNRVAHGIVGFLNNDSGAGLMFPAPLFILLPWLAPALQGRIIRRSSRRRSRSSDCRGARDWG